MANSALYGCGWKDGVESERSEPRKIHGRGRVVLLVGGVYKCSKIGHEVASYHPGILRQINAKSLIIFQLLLKTGYFIRFIKNIILSGLRLSTIQNC